MPSTAVKARLAQDLALWQADGLIAEDTRAILSARYDAPGFGLATLIKYLGIAGGVIAAFGLLGFFAAMAESVGVGAFMAGSAAAFFLWSGQRLASDPLGRYVHVSKVVSALGLVALVGAVTCVCQAFSLPEKTTIFLVGLVPIPIAFGLAYYHRNIFMLILGLMGAFHWVGSWSSMMGRSTYEFDVQDPKLMCGAALVAIMVGYVHERYYAERWPRFNHAYLTFGLIYLNLSLLILTVWEREGVKPWIVVLTVACLAEMVLGAYMKSRLLMGFGVTTLCIDLFTRYFEEFWDKLEAGRFFLLGGALLFVIGFSLERAAARAQSRGWL